MITKGIFIDFEGGEGSGKSTQIRRLQKYFAEKYGAERVVTTHEPGGGIPDFRQRIFDIRNKNPNISQSDLAKKEFDFFVVDRAFHVKNLIRPKMDAGCIVLCDRFAPSTIAYQGYARGMDLETIRRVNEEATGGLAPDLVILLDIDPTIGVARKFKHQAEELTSFDKEQLPFHEKVRKGFLTQEKEDPDHWVVIDANQSEDVITAQIITELIKRFTI